MTVKARAMTMACRMALALFGPGLALCVLSPSEARAEPTKWTLARDPQAAERQQLYESVEQLRHRYDRFALLNRFDNRGKVENELNLRKLATLADAATKRFPGDPHFRWRAGWAYSTLDQSEPTIRVLAPLCLPGPDPVDGDAIGLYRAEACDALGVEYARLGYFEKEVRAYDLALASDPMPASRAKLLGNQAEAFMVLGDLKRAIAGYRAALALLTQPGEIYNYSPTLYWGLAVALDRTGNLEAAIDSIKLARSYDPEDAGIESSNWFYVPWYDKHWYQALGHLAAARHTDLASVRASALTEAARSFRAYLAEADETDRWLRLAEARLRFAESELVRVTGRAASATKGSAGPTVLSF